MDDVTTVTRDTDYGEIQEELLDEPYFASITTYVSGEMTTNWHLISAD